MGEASQLIIATALGGDSFFGGNSRKGHCSCTTSGALFTQNTTRMVLPGSIAPKVNFYIHQIAQTFKLNRFKYFCQMKIALYILFFFLDFFLMWTIFNIFIEFVTILLLFYVLIFWPGSTWDLSSLTRDQTRTPCIGRQSLNHWTTRKVPILIFTLSQIILRRIYFILYI